MGRIGVVKEVKAVVVDGDNAIEITVDFGADDTATALDFTPAGLIGRPQVGDLAILVEVDGGEEYAIVGYVDHDYSNPAGNGEIYLYSRDANGALASYVHLKSTGEVLLVNSSGAVTLAADGSMKLQNSNNEVDLGATGCLINGHLTVAAGQNP